MKKLHTLGKQCLALLITATMCFSMMQVTAFAEDVSTEPHNEGIELYSGEDGDDVENPKTTSETKDGITTTTTITVTKTEDKETGNTTETTITETSWSNTSEDEDSGSDSSESSGSEDGGSEDGILEDEVPDTENSGSESHELSVDGQETKIDNVVTNVDGEIVSQYGSAKGEETKTSTGITETQTGSATADMTDGKTTVTVKDENGESKYTVETSIPPVSVELTPGSSKDDTLVKPTITAPELPKECDSFDEETNTARKVVYSRDAKGNATGYTETVTTAEGVTETVVAYSVDQDGNYICQTTTTVTTNTTTDESVPPTSSTEKEPGDVSFSKVEIVLPDKPAEDDSTSVYNVMDKDGNIIGYWIMTANQDGTTSSELKLGKKTNTTTTYNPINGTHTTTSTTVTTQEITRKDISIILGDRNCQRCWEM